MPPALSVDTTSPVPRVAVLGNDAVLAARPATPVQLAHACRRAGFELAVPPNWGDELVAAECVRQLERRDRAPAIHCACPHVASRLLATGGELTPFLVPLVSPPAAAARYLRRAYGAGGVHITYVGDCPGAVDEAIDARISPVDFYDALASRRIDLAAQPLVFDSVIPPDRRRHASLPGGLPTPEVLWALERRVLVELDEQEFLPELAQHLVAADCVLMDLAPRLGCACAGAGIGVPASAARQAILAIEPPRAPHPPVDTNIDLQLARPLPALPPATAAGAPTVPSPGEPQEPAPAAPSWMAVSAAPGRPRRRTTPSGFFRSYTASVPQTRSGEGRPLPRAYVARRDSPIVLWAIPSPERADRPRDAEGSPALNGKTQPAEPPAEPSAGAPAPPESAIVAQPAPGEGHAAQTARAAAPPPSAPPLNPFAAAAAPDQPAATSSMSELGAVEMPPSMPRAPTGALEPALERPLERPLEAAPQPEPTVADSPVAAPAVAPGNRLAVRLAVLLLVALAVGVALALVVDRLAGGSLATGHKGYALASAADAPWRDAPALPTAT
jgi:hypothetical protein